MAITTDHPGLEVNLLVNGAPLPEYDDLQADDTAPSPAPSKTVIKYVGATSGAEFAIGWLFRPPFIPSFQIQPDVFLDGKFILIPDIKYNPRSGHEGYACAGGQSFKDDKMFMQNFRFSDLVVEEGDRPISETLRRQLLECGQIQLNFHFVESIHQVAQTELPRLDFDFNEIGTLSEKAHQKCSAVMGDVPTQLAGLSAPEELPSRSLNELRTVGDGPFASFVFKYRSTKALKDLGIIPRTPVPTPPRSPTPLYERDEQALVQLQPVQQDQRVKREREDSADIVIADWSDEVEWTGSQPAKRVRAPPTAADEVVDLED